MCEETSAGSSLYISRPACIPSVMQGGVIRMTYAALEKMSQQSGGRGGVVVNTASVGGKDHPTRTPQFFIELEKEDPAMPKNTLWGWDVPIQSLSSTGLGPLASCPVYSATKHGVIGFTRAMAVRMYSCVFAHGPRQRTFKLPLSMKIQTRINARLGLPCSRLWHLRVATQVFTIFTMFSDST